MRGSLGWDIPSATATDAEQRIDTTVTGQRMYATGLMGLAAGFRYVHAAVEIQGGYQSAHATLWGTDTSVQGATITPAAAILGSF